MKNQNKASTLRSALLTLVYIFALVFALLIFCSRGPMIFVPLILAYAFVLIRKDYPLLLHLITASVIGFIWVVFSKEQYGYSSSSGILMIGGYFVFPGISAAIAFFLVYIVYLCFRPLIKNGNYFTHTALYSLIYIFILLSFETIGYHLLGIKNEIKAGYSGLPLLNSLHAPRWMILSYLSGGAIFFTICWILGLEKKGGKFN